MTDEGVLPGEVRDEIAYNFEHRLHAQGSLILDNVSFRNHILSQIQSILDEVVAGYRGPIDLSAMSQAAEISATQAIEGIHPAEFLCAANVLFETALPFVLGASSASGRPDAELGAALTLHRATMIRIASSAIFHNELMLKTIRDSRGAELARLSRDLHDRVAHAIGVAIQNLELYEVHADRDVAWAQEKLHRAREAMRQALDSVRQFSVELRTTVQPGELEHALTEYLAANAESNVVTSVEVTGDTAMLPGDVCEEVYVTLREAIRNALVHSGTTRLSVTLGITKSQLHARVSDTGRGFLVEETTNAVGLSSMRNRTQLLGGTLLLSSVPGQGTTVEISIPLNRVLR